MSDDWLDESLLNPEDPEAEAREARRREREARRREREPQQATPDPPPQATPPPPRATPDPPQTARSWERDGDEAGSRPAPPDEGVPPAEQPLPQSPAREPFTARVAAMRKRLADSRPRRSPGGTKPPRPEDRASGGGALALARSRWAWIALGVVALLLIWFLIALFQPFHGGGGSAVEVTIPKGATASDVGDILDKRGVISSDAPFVSASTLFHLRIKLAGKTGDIKPGTYPMRRDESYGDAIDQLTGTAHPASTASPTSLVRCQSTCSITIPEGLSRAQIAPYMSKGGLRGSYLAESTHSKFLNPNQYGAQGRARNLEGFLFPDTFDLPRHAPVANLVQLQLQDFRRRIKGVDMRYARSKNLTTYDVLIIASMIEREVQIPSERKLVAAVIYNRLHRGMPLGIDATTRFAVGNYTSPLTESQLASPSPYNTRIHPGLPPGPIGNPGLAAIQAAAKPAKVNYLYYVVKPGTCGVLSFSSTAAQFARDQAAYQRALNAKGSSPTTC